MRERSSCKVKSQAEQEGTSPKCCFVYWICALQMSAQGLFSLTYKSMSQDFGVRGFLLLAGFLVLLPLKILASAHTTSVPTQHPPQYEIQSLLWFPSHQAFVQVLQNIAGGPGKGSCDRAPGFVPSTKFFFPTFSLHFCLLPPLFQKQLKKFLSLGVSQLPGLGWGWRRVGRGGELPLSKKDTSLEGIFPKHTHSAFSMRSLTTKVSFPLVSVSWTEQNPLWLD